MIIDGGLALCNYATHPANNKGADQTVRMALKFLRESDQSLHCALNG